MALISAFCFCLPLLLHLKFSEAGLMPSNFKCAKNSAIKDSVYSNPINGIKIDLTYIFCGAFVTKTPEGFRARPDNKDPDSASTADSLLLKNPISQYDFAIFDKPKVYNKASVLLSEGGPSNMWPSAMSHKDITVLLYDMVKNCGPEKGKHICVRNFSLAPLISSVPTFDIRIYMQGTKVVKDAYPVQKDECLRDKEFKMCDYATLKAGAPFS